MSKIHFAYVERGNESNPHDEWGDTVCGLEMDDKYLSNRKTYVTCKNCLKLLKDCNESGFFIKQSNAE